jgi:rRNA maturation endonuclease Nob1
MRRCEACGNEIDNDFNYCRECGEFVEPVEADEDEDED